MVYANGTDLVAFDENGNRIMELNLEDYYRSEAGIYFHKSFVPKNLISETSLTSLLRSSEENRELSDYAEERRNLLL